MNTIDRRLVELNEAILGLHKSRNVPENIIKQAQSILAGAEYTFNGGAGDDTIILNTQSPKPCECPPGPPGPPGERGETGPKGDKGDKGDSGECECSSITVSSNYAVSTTDYYVGVDSTEPVTITLPVNLVNCKQIVIKAQMAPPVGNRKITIVTSDESLIEGNDSIILEKPYDTITLFYNDGWWII